MTTPSLTKSATLREKADAAERAAIVAALRATSGNVGAAAEQLGLNRRTLDRRINAHNLRAWLTKSYPRSVRRLAE